MSSSLYVVFRQDVLQVAQKYQLKRVRRGYFANYLFPKGYAEMATPELLIRLKDKIETQKKEALMAKATLSEKAKKLLGVILKLQAKASAKGTLFRAISEKALITALKDQAGVEVEKSQISSDPIKKVGSHTLNVKFGNEEMKVAILVEAKKEEKA